MYLGGCQFVYKINIFFVSKNNIDVYVGGCVTYKISNYVKLCVWLVIRIVPAICANVWLLERVVIPI